jgi:GxxExxY protein
VNFSNKLELNREDAKNAKINAEQLVPQIGGLAMDIEKIATIIVDSAIKVHRTLGPGLLESAYQQCHAYELRKHGMRVECELLLPIMYDGLKIDAGYRIDSLVEECIIIENKAIDKLMPIHEAQLLTYLKLRNCRLGFLLNWNVRLMRDGIKRMVYKL